MAVKSSQTSEPRWPAALALLSIGGLHYALPSELTVGPDWLAPGLGAGPGVPATSFPPLGHWRPSPPLCLVPGRGVGLCRCASPIAFVCRARPREEPPG